MEYFTHNIPEYPSFIVSGNAVYRPGDNHRRRTNIGFFDIIFIEYGELYIDDGGNRYTLRKNDVLILHPNRTHFGYKVCSTKTFFHWLHFHTSEPFEFTEVFSLTSESNMKTSNFERLKTKIVIPTYQTFPTDVFNQIITCLKDTESLQINKYSNTSEKSIFKTNLFQNQINFLKILSMLCVNQNQTNACATSNLVMNYLQSNYGEDITLKMLSTIANCHPTHLIRSFKKAYDTTPFQALINIRLQQSKIMLLTTNFSCQEISQQCGFQSVSYFSNTFKKFCKYTPNEYRKNGK